MKKTIQTAIFLAAMSFSLQTGTASDKTLYQADLQGDHGDLPSGWRKAYNTSVPTAGTGIFGDAFVIDSENWPSFRTFTFDPDVAANWKDYTLTAEFEATNFSNLAVVIYARCDETTTIHGGGKYVVPGYQLQVFNNTLYLVRDIGGNFFGRDNGEVLGSYGLREPMLKGELYALELTVNGEELQGRLLEGGADGAEIGKISAKDATHLKGSIGVGAGFGGFDRQIVFRKIQVVPVKK